MFGKSRRDKTSPTPQAKAAKGQPTPAKRDLAREDADSPNAIPILPPRGDGS